MEKHKHVKRNHHYVWSFYLKSWATGNDLFYITPKGKISQGSVKGLAKETDFYKISPLNDEDVEFIKNFSAKSPQFLQDIHMLHLADFIRLSHVSNRISNLEYSSEELSKIDSVIRHNSLENLHSFIENTAVEVVSKLAQGDYDCLKSKDNMIAFCSYIGHQISRTKSFKDKSMETIYSNKASSNILSSHIELLEKNWWFLSFMFGINIGCSLYQSRDQDNHVYIINKTDHPFITSDEPIINLHSSLNKLSEKEAPDFADFYIPLSPKYAYMINNSSEFNHLANLIEADEVMKFNTKIAEKSYKTIFGSTEMSLKFHNKTINPTGR